jgi:hypothetical protein
MSNVTKLLEEFMTLQDAKDTDDVMEAVKNEFKKLSKDEQKAILEEDLHEWIHEVIDIDVFSSPTFVIQLFKDIWFVDDYRQLYTGVSDAVFEYLLSSIYHDIKNGDY